MDRNDVSQPILLNDEESPSVLISNMLLDNFGDVVLTHNSDGLSWKSSDSIANEHHETCLGIKMISNRVSAIRFSDIYAVEFVDWGLIHESALTNAGGCFQSHSSELFRFSVHFVQRSRTHQSLWVPSAYTFGHKDSQTCQLWVDRINTNINMDAGRPKSLLVFINPRSGKGNGCRTWEAVAPIFSHAKVKTKEIVTERAGQAFDVMSAITNKELNTYDGVIAVGGDGFFSEILNGLLLSRHKASYPPRPTDSEDPVETDGNVSVHDPEVTSSVSSSHCEDESPLLAGSELGRTGVTNLST